MFDKGKYQREYYIKNREIILNQANKYYWDNKKEKELKVCVFCEKEYYPRSYKSICCSVECIWKERNRKNGESKRISKNCKYCNRDFINTNETRTYCSKECRIKWWKEDNRINERIVCCFCSKEFDRCTKHRKFCSTDCYKGYWKIHPNRLIRDKERQKEYRKWYVKSTPERKLHYQLSDRIRKHLRAKGTKKDKYLINILGCSVMELIQHIESQFKEGMTWANHSVKGWHIDHKKPLKSAKTKEEVYRLWHYTNLQPLWASENLQKGGKY